MEPIDYSKFTMEQLMEIRKELSAEIMKRAVTEEVEDMKRVRNELDVQISKMNFYRSRNSI